MRSAGRHRAEADTKRTEGVTPKKCPLRPLHEGDEGDEEDRICFPVRAREAPRLRRAGRLARDLAATGRTPMRKRSDAPQPDLWAALGAIADAEDRRRAIFTDAQLLALEACSQLREEGKNPWGRDQGNRLKFRVTRGRKPEFVAVL